MNDLTAAERRGALMLIAILVLGAAYDLWRAGRPPAAPAPVARALESPPLEPAGRWSDSTARPSVSASDTAPPRLDLNRATRDELDALPGIGPVLADRILAHRARYGAFRTLDELRAVRGIGPRLLERLRPRLIVRSPEAVAGPG